MRAGLRAATGIEALSRPARLACSWAIRRAFHEDEDRAEREAAPLQETHLAGALALVGGRLREAARPDARDVRCALLSRGAKRRVDRVLRHALRAQRVRELDRAEAPRLGADRLLGVARVRKPAALREIVEHRCDVVTLGDEGRELARELRA